MILFKAVFIFFIALGLGLLYLLYYTGVTSIAAWAALSLITLFMCVLYTVFFTDIELFAGKGQDISRMDHIVYQTNGFDVVSPLLQQKTMITWADIETILYDNKPYNDYDSFGERYTFILKSPLVSQLDPDASWYN